MADSTYSLNRRYGLVDEAEPGAGVSEKPATRFYIGAIERVTIFALSMVANILTLLLITQGLGLFQTDAMGSTVQAWLLLSGNLFSFAASSSTLPPLPALLQAPLALVPYVWREALSGGLLTATAGALICTATNGLLGGMRITHGWRWALVATIGLNPIFLFFAASGSGWMVVALLDVIALSLFVSWSRSYRSGETTALSYLITLSFVVGLSILAGYENVVLAFLVAILLCLHDRQTRSTRSGNALALLITFCVPVISVLGIWLWFVVLVATDPSRLLMVDGLPAMWSGHRWMDSLMLAPLSSNPLLDMNTTASWAWVPIGIFAVGEVALLVDSLINRRLHSLTLSLLALAIPMCFLVAAVGDRPDWWSPALLPVSILGPILLGQVVSRSTGKTWGGTTAQLAIACVGISLAASIGGVTFAAAQTYNGRSTVPAEADTYAEEQQIAQFLNQHVGSGKVLIDDEEAYRIVFFARGPDIFLMRGEPGYDQALRSPQGRVDYLLIRKPSQRSISDLNRISGQYPILYDLGSDWSKLLGEWKGTGWRLYSVKARPGTGAP